MKSILIQLIAFFIIISMPTTSKAQLPDDCYILNGQNRQLTSLMLFKLDLTQIDSGYKIKTILRDSTVTDSLLIHLCLPKILVKSLSFSRHDTAYCYANKFPPSDSLKWRQPYRNPGNSYDTIKLRDSILELKIAHENKVMNVIWHLKKKYTFNIGDTFSLVLAAIPDRPLETLPQNEYMLKSRNPMKNKMFFLIDGYPRHFLTEEQTPLPLFDVSGKRLLFAPRKSFVFIIP